MQVIRLHPPAGPAHRRGRSAPLRAWSASGAPPGELIYVRPLATGWCVEVDGMEPVLFRKGAQAELQARRLAKCLARLGNDASVRIYDAGNRLAGGIDYFAVEGELGPTRGDRYPWRP